MSRLAVLLRMVALLIVFTLLSGLPAMAESSIVLPVYTKVKGTGIDFVHVNGDPTRKDYIPEAKGGGIGFLDYDNDGWLDIYVVQGSTVQRIRNDDSPHGRLYRNKRDGTFEDVTQKAALTRRGWGMGVGAADYNNDGYVDLYLTYLGSNVLYRNNGDGTFTDVTEEAGVGERGWSTSAAFGDYDQDGLLDLYVAGYIVFDFENLPAKRCSHRGNVVLCGPLGLQGAPDVLYHNNGDGTFTDVTQSSGAVDRDRGYGLGVVWADFDNDGDPDVAVANDATPNLLFVNQGNGTFVERGFPSGLALNADGLEQAGMGIDAADYDNDGLLDVIMTHFALEYSALYRNSGSLLFQDVTARAGLVQPEWLLVSWGVRFVDFNSDGWKDIIHSNGHVYPYLLTSNSDEKYGQPKSFYLNNGNGTFKDVGALVGADVRQPEVSRGTAFGDFDNDGDLDFIVANLNGTPSLFRCDRRDDNHWIMVRTVGRKSNRDGIGARISVTAENQTQIREIKRTLGIYSVSDPRAHFGLGKATKVDKVSIRWPSGSVQEFENVEAGRHYVIDEEKGLRPEFPE